MHYWGVKVHVVALKVRNTTPVPARLFVGLASEHDYRAQPAELANLVDHNLSGDKAFESKELKQVFEEGEGVFFVGRKDNYAKNVEQRRRGKAADQGYNRAVSELKQSI